MMSDSESMTINDYSFNLHEMKSKLEIFVESMTSYQIYQFMNLNPFLIDEDELHRINVRDDFKDMYEDSVQYE